MNDPFAALDTLYAHIWDRLARGVADAADPFRFVTLATIGADGPEARTVGLRRADPETRRVEVHSDCRTAKVRALQADPRAQLLFWDAATQLQLRLSVVVALQVGAQDRWAKIPSSARLNYGTNPAPGTPVSAPEAVTRTPERARFIAISGQVHKIDVVSLKHVPHRRAVFEGEKGQWVAP